VRYAILAAVAAAAATVVPLPSAAVERWYSLGVYPVIQNVVTWLSSLVSVALLDVGVLVALGSWLAFVTTRWRASGARAGLKVAAVSLVATMSVIYLVFLAVWGLNYRRQPLEVKLAYDPARVTPDGTFQLGQIAVEQVNTLEPAKASRSPYSREAMMPAFADVQRHLGARSIARPAMPKRSAVSWYLRHAGIDGMIDPLFLEIILNPDVLTIEMPFTLAHEWAHLAGYANESDANFVAWLTCIRSDSAAQYSGWLEAYRYAEAALPRERRRELQRRLSPAVIADLRAISARLGRVNPVVSGFARNVYDTYLKTQGVDEGLASYSAMLKLMVGTTFENGWVPNLRH
jgi:Protein of unknown function (DUF3810)